jgi:hypothetical protein
MHTGTHVGRWVRIHLAERQQCGPAQTAHRARTALACRPTRPPLRLRGKVQGWGAPHLHFRAWAAGEAGAAVGQGAVLDDAGAEGLWEAAHGDAQVPLRRMANGSALKTLSITTACHKQKKTLCNTRPPCCKATWGSAWYAQRSLRDRGAQQRHGQACQYKQPHRSTCVQVSAKVGKQSCRCTTCAERRWELVQKGLSAEMPRPRQPRNPTPASHLQVLHNGGGERQGRGLLHHLGLRQLVLHHELRQVPDHLAGGRDLQAATRTSSSTHTTNRASAINRTELVINSMQEGASSHNKQKVRKALGRWGDKGRDRQRHWGRWSGWVWGSQRALIMSPSTRLAAA